MQYTVSLFNMYVTLYYFNNLEFFKQTNKTKLYPQPVSPGASQVVLLPPYYARIGICGKCTLLFAARQSIPTVHAGAVPKTWFGSAASLPTVSIVPIIHIATRERGGATLAGCSFAMDGCHSSRRNDRFSSSWIYCCGCCFSKSSFLASG